MVRHYSEAEVVAILDGLDAARLRAFVAAHVVTPVVTPRGHAFTEADVARLQLLCDLCDIYDLPSDALAMVMSLIDQLNGLRGDMRAMLEAVAAEAPETRARLRQVIRETRVTIITDE